MIRKPGPSDFESRPRTPYDRPRKRARQRPDYATTSLNPGLQTLFIGIACKRAETSMGQLIVSEMVSLDGVMQAPGGPEEDTEGGFKHGGWQMPLLDEESFSLITRDIGRMDALLLGRKTYDIFAAYWPRATTGKIADKLNNAPKYVASRSRRRLEGNNSTLIQGDLSNEVARIKQEHGEVHVIGSGDLVQTLLRHDLVDRFNLWVYPLLLGTGKRLFGEGTLPAGLRLTSSQAFPKGAIHLAYERAPGSPSMATCPSRLS